MSAVAAFELTSTATQAAAPFMIGHAFVKGDVPSGQYAEIDLPNFVVQPLNYWNDGSLKLAAIIGRVPLTANVAKRVNIVKRSSAQAAGTLLTAASIAAAAPTASIQFGSFGTVSLSSLLASPQLTYISTKEMVSCVYASKCGSDPSLFAQFIVNLFVDGRMEVWACGGNGYLNDTHVQKDYVPTVIIGGVTVWNNSGATYRHSHGAGWDQVAWIGGDPAITPRHDTGYLNRTGLIPNYWKTGTSQPAIDAHIPYQTYTPGANLLFSEDMGGTGYQADIGPLPNWDAMYCTSQANATMYKVVIAHARAIRSYAIGVHDTSTLKVAKISDFPRWSHQGFDQGGQSVLSSVKQDNATALNFEKAHHTSAAFLAAALTAQYRHMETCLMQAVTIFLCNSINEGIGLNRTVEGQMRTRAWSIRTISEAGSIVPGSLSGLFGEVRTWAANLFDSRVTKYVTPSYAGKFLGTEDPNGTRYDTTAGLAPNGQQVICLAPWENHFLSGTVGRARDLEPCDATGMTKLAQYHAFVGQFPVNMAGGGGSTEYNFGYLSGYILNLRSNTNVTYTNSPVPVSYLNPSDMGMVFRDTHGYLSDGTTIVNVDDNPTNGFPAPTTFNPPNPATTTLMGHSPSSPTGYFSNWLPAIASAVDYALTGAATGWSRFVGASNFSAQDTTANYADTPVWSVVPRTHSQPPLTYTAVDSGAPVPTPGPTIIMDSASFLTGAIVMDSNRGRGILGPAIPTAGTAPHPLLNDVDVSDPVGTEYAYEVTAIPPGLTSFLINQDGSITASGPDGLHAGVQITKKNGVFTPGVPFTITIGTLTSIVSGVTVTPGSATIAAGASQTFVSSVNGTGSPSQAVTWTTTAGSVFGGVLTAPAGSSGTVTATSVQNPGKSGTASFTVAAAGTAGTTGPVMVGQISATATASTISASWLAATDADGIAEYKISMNGATPFSTGLNLTANYSALSASTLYTLAVTAYDTVGNPSSVPLTLDVMTLAASGAPDPVPDPVLPPLAPPVTVASRSLPWLKQAVENWTHRPGFAADPILDDFIMLAEKRINDDLEARLQETVTTIACTAGINVVPAPFDMSEITSLSIPQHGPLGYITPDQYNDEFTTGSTGVPRFYTVIGPYLYLGATPDSAYSLKCAYRQQLPSLLDAVDGINWLIRDQPNIYLAATMCEALVFTQNESQIPAWEAKYKIAIDALNLADWHTGGTMTVRSDVLH